MDRSGDQDPIYWPVARRLDLRSSHVGAVASPQRPRWSHRRRLALALSLLTEPRLDGLITGESRFRDLPATMTALAEAPRGVLCHRISYRE